MHEEITFQGQCEICGRKNTPCRNHHVVPRRLLAIIPKNRAHKFEFWKIRICNSCNNQFHIENKFHKRICLLEQILEYNNINIEESLKEMNQYDN
jgi:hypothetical protein